MSSDVYVCLFNIQTNQPTNRICYSAWKENENIRDFTTRQHENVRVYFQEKPTNWIFILVAP